MTSNPPAPTTSLHALAGNPAAPEEVEKAIERTQMLLAVVARIWEVPAFDVEPAATYSADWDDVA